MTEISNAPSTEHFLSKLFAAHGIPAIVENGWVVPHSELPAIRALWYPSEHNGRLDVQTLVEKGVLIDESFAGVGQGDDALRDALGSFTVNLFHVLLAALWNVFDPDQVVKETWPIAGRTFEVFIGNFGTRQSSEFGAPIPHGLFDAIEATIQRESLTDSLHWFRFFFCNLASEWTYEALKDNEPWDEGVRCLQAAPWARHDSYYSVRLFIVVRAS